MLSISPKITIDLGAIGYNYKGIANIIKKPSVCAAVLKNDAYGLGAKQVSQTLYASGCRDFWVAYMTEAMKLREILPLDSNIYFLQGFNIDYIQQIRKHNLIPTINSVEEFHSINGSNIEIVLHVDTGLNRLGIRSSDANTICQNISNLKIKYIISHLSCADDSENPNNLEQKHEFSKILERFKKIFPKIKASISSSFGIFIDHDYTYDMVRAGAYLYGIQTKNLKPKNVLSMSSLVLQKYKVPKGTKIGYGATYITDQSTIIAVISVGYADGIRRSLSKLGQIMFYEENGKQYRAKILGAISMDLLVCDVTSIPDELTEPYQRAFILDDNYTINEMAKDSSTIPYEILTGINFRSPRIEKIYI